METRKGGLQSGAGFCALVAEPGPPVEIVELFVQYSVDKVRLVVAFWTLTLGEALRLELLRERESYPLVLRETNTTTRRELRDGTETHARENPPNLAGLFVSAVGSGALFEGGCRCLLRSPLAGGAQ